MHQVSGGRHGTAGVVGGEEVGPPVAAQVAPDGVDVVRAVLDVVVLQQERRRPHRVVVAGAPLAAHPAQAKVVAGRSGPAHRLPRRAGERGRQPVDVEPEQPLEHPALGAVACPRAPGLAARRRGRPPGRAGSRCRPARPGRSRPPRAGRRPAARAGHVPGPPPAAGCAAPAAGPGARPPGWLRRTAACRPRRSPTTVRCTARWWPFTRQAQGLRWSGAPRTRTQKWPGWRRCQPGLAGGPLQVREHGLERHDVAGRAHARRAEAGAQQGHRERAAVVHLPQGQPGGSPAGRSTAWSGCRTWRLARWSGVSADRSAPAASRIARRSPGCGSSARRRGRAGFHGRRPPFVVHGCHALGPDDAVDPYAAERPSQWTD